jgi:hypothetical protein
MEGSNEFNYRAAIKELSKGQHGPEARARILHI